MPQPLTEAFGKRAHRWRSRILSLAIAISKQGDGEATWWSDQAFEELLAIDRRVMGNRSGKLMVDWPDLNLMFVGAFRRAIEILEATP